MGMKEYVLWGGGLLVVLVVAHGLWQALRSRRRRNAAHAEIEPVADSGGAAQMDMLEPPVLRDVDETVEAPASADAPGYADSAVAAGSAAADDVATAETNDAAGAWEPSAEGLAPGREEPSAGEPEGLVPGSEEPSAGEPEGLAPGSEEPSAGEPEGLAPRREEPSAGEPEGLAPRREEPSAGEPEGLAAAKEEDAIESEADSARRGRRIVIPGKRTEPTVPRNDHLFKVRTTPPEQGRAPPAPPGLDQVVVIWVVAKPGTSFDGQELVRALADNGLRYGNDALFRKFDVDSGEELFSVVNGVEPGTFDLSDLEALSTPRIVMLLSLVSATTGLAAFSEMLDAAQDISISLGGELRDENMGPMTGQTIEHYRQRISDYKRKSLRK